MSFLVVMAELSAKENCEDELIALAESLVEETLKEEGNIDYKFLKAPKENKFTFIEQWESAEALSKHMASPHFQLFSKESADLAEGMGIKVLGAEEVNLYE